MPPGLQLGARYSTTDINKSGAKIYDEAWAKGGVEITRRNQHFVLMRVDYLDHLIEQARNNQPQSLEELFHGYDAEKIKNLTTDFEAAPSAGQELI